MRILRFIWRALNNLRRVLHLVLLLFIFALLLVGTSSRVTVVPDGAALIIAPSGALVEQLSGEPVERALAELQGAPAPETAVRDVVDALRSAATDKRIEVVVLDPDGLTAGGLPKLAAVAAAIEEVRAAGKRVIAVGDSYTQAQYYLAAHADEIHMHDFGLLLVDGFGYFRTYFKSAIDKLKVDMNVFRVGEYKSFVEPFLRDDMSDEDRAAARGWIGGLWQRYQAELESARQLDPGTIAGYANGFVERLRAAGGNAGRAALDAGLVDRLQNREQFREYMSGLVGADKDSPRGYKSVHFLEYLAAVRPADALSVEPANVGVVVAAGDIIDGEASPGTIGGDTLAQLLLQARNDDAIKAVVLRIDSPGGSMFASEVVYNQVRALREAGKPVIASMSSVAASGGYYIAMPADEIWASENTITGSIGVGALFPTVQDGLDALGIHVDGFGTAPLAGQLRLDRELGDEARALFQLGVEEAYQIFLARVAESRGMSTEAVDRVARGRVWTGADARERGLVDRFGGLPEAISAAAERAGLKDGTYGIRYVQKPLTLGERLAMQWAARARGALRALWPADGSLVARVARRIDAELGVLRTLNDPRGLYYHCFCEVR